MFKLFGIVLTTAAMFLSMVFLIFIFIRIKNCFTKNKPRISLWNTSAGLVMRLLKLLMAVSIPFLVAGIIYYLFVITLPTAAMREYAKAIFAICLIVWAVIELCLCFSISEKLLKGSIFRRIIFFIGVVLCIVGAVRLFPLILKSFPFPPKSECVILELPVHGTWLAGQAGATPITNGHITNRYAIDLVRLGPDHMFFKGEAKSVTGFYSFNEPVYAPADGIVTQMIDSLPSDSLDIADKNNPGGNYVIIDIGKGRYVYFGHLRQKSIAVRAGQTIKTGTLIGYAGNSGYSTLPHVHLHVQSKPIADPAGRITYPFRFSRMNRTRLFFRSEVQNGYLIRNDKFSN